MGARRVLISRMGKTNMDVWKFSAAPWGIRKKKKIPASPGRNNNNNTCTFFLNIERDQSNLEADKSTWFFHYISKGACRFDRLSKNVLWAVFVYDFLYRLFALTSEVGVILHPVILRLRIFRRHLAFVSYT